MNEHNPPHFHAEYQEFKITVTIDNGIVEGTMPRRALKLIFDWMDLHKKESIENWNSIKEQGEFKKIEPLN